MKTLYLLRHASRAGTIRLCPTVIGRWKPAASDAAKMGKRWSQRNRKPDLMMSSPAVRALATAKVVAQGVDYKTKNIAVNDRLYAATQDTWIAVIEAFDDKLDRVMLVGHQRSLPQKR